MGGCCTSDRDSDKPAPPKAQSHDTEQKAQDVTATSAKLSPAKKPKKADPSPSEEVKTISRRSSTIPFNHTENVPPSQNAPRKTSLMYAFRRHYRFGALMWRDGETEVRDAEFISTKLKCVVRTKPKIKSASAKASVQAEVDVLSRLNYPLVTKLLEFAEDISHYYIVTEFHGKVRLVDYFDASKVGNEPVTAKIMAQLFAGVNYCHAQGIVLRNISLSTIVFESEPVDDTYRIKLFNFEESGKAGTQKDLSDAVRQSSYLAPEALNHLCAEKNDLWSCGMVMHFLLSGELPLQKVLNFDSANWKMISEEAKSLLTALLRVNSFKRPSAGESLNHPWFSRSSQVSTQLMQEAVEKLSSARAHTLLKQLIIKFIISRVIKNEKFAKLAEAFIEFDENLDGFVSKQELYNGLIGIMPEDRARRETEKIMSAVDEDGNGLLDYSEFLQSAYGDQELMSRQNLIAAFNSFDTDGSGRISLKELRTGLGLGPEDEEVWKGLLADVDTNGDGEIDYEEFVAMMQNAMQSDSAVQNN